MQPGPVDISHPPEFGQKIREKNAAAPVVGASLAAPTAAAASGAQVELQIVAVNLSAATSAASSVRAEEPTAKLDHERPGSQAAEPRLASAASLELSARAQRLALIPAQVMDPEELAQAKRELEEAKEELARLRADQKQEDRAVEIEDRIAADRERASQTGGASSETRHGPAMKPAEALTGPTPAAAGPASDEATPISRSPRSRPDPATLMHGRSPFESSTPRAAGQSLDIVVGKSAE